MPFDEEGNWEDYEDEEFIESPRELSEMGLLLSESCSVMVGRELANQLYMSGMTTAALSVANSVDLLTDFYTENSLVMFGKELWYDENVERWRETETGIFARDCLMNPLDFSRWV
jgi:hypothetical protein